jgi:hypothetical protein
VKILILVCGVVGALTSQGQTPARPLADKTAASYQEMVRKPKPLPRREHERVSRAMLRVQAAMLAAEEGRVRIRVAEEAYAALLAELQSKYDAEGCELTLEKAWRCAPRAPGGKPGAIPQP